MTRVVVLPDVLRRAILREARAAHPRECCGLIEGVRDGETVRATALHATANLAEAPDRFQIDPRVQFRLLREGRTIVGCYHSHPNGRAEPSPRDLEGAGEEDFVWVIAAGRTLAAFVYRAGGFPPLALAP